MERNAITSTFVGPIADVQNFGGYLTDSVLWSREDHTRAKHQILREYVNAWLPVMAYQALKIQATRGVSPRLLLVDGFAGPGRYEDGEPGSPLIMIEALLQHPHLARFSDVEFIYLFIEHDAKRVEHLREEVARLDLPDNLQVILEEGEFEEKFGQIVDEINAKSNSLAPTFAFIDPFGYSTNSMELTGKLLDFDQCEALVFLPLTYLARFVSREGQERALDSLFGTREWEKLIPLSGQARSDGLLALFEQQLLSHGQTKFVRSFQLRTKDGNDYRLVFATGHAKGIELMKRAMWSVDPVNGTTYATKTDAGQEVLFEL